ncbi:hypothetical protein T484DRAFT_1831240, partial [Baffinella frigidus]
KEAEKKEAEKKEAEKKEAEKKEAEKMGAAIVLSDTESDSGDDVQIVEPGTKGEGNPLSGRKRDKPDGLFASASAAKSADGGSAVQQAIPVYTDNNNKWPCTDKRFTVRKLSKNVSGVGDAANIFHDVKAEHEEVAKDLLTRMTAAIDGMPTFESLITVRDMIASYKETGFQKNRTKILEDLDASNFWAPFLNVHFLTLISINRVEKQMIFDLVHKAMFNHFPALMDVYLQARSTANAAITENRRIAKKAKMSMDTNTFE